MMRHTVPLVVLAWLLAAPALAQDPPRAEQLRAQIEQRFSERVQEALALTPDQATRLREVGGRWFRQRRELGREEQALRRGLAAQMRPGVAADGDSVGRMVERLAAVRVEQAESYRDELAELRGFLTPVQRAQFFMLRERLLRQVEDAMERRGAR